MKNKNCPTYIMWHDEFSVPQQNLKIYRFMNLKKFEDILKGGLFFAKASVLSDKFEGGYLIPELAKEFVGYKNDTFVSCWTENDPRIDSSMLLWELYSRNENLVAIGVSIDKFFSVFFQDGKFEKYIGKINYLDPDNPSYPDKFSANSLVPFFLKRKHFEDEKEVRIIIQDMDPTGILSFNVNQESKGIPIPIDFSKIDEIIVSPKAEYGFYEEVDRLVKSFGLDKTVEQLSMPSNVDFKEIEKKVKCINKHNDRELDNIENYNDVEREFVNQDYGTWKPDASGNMRYIRCESDDNSGSSSKKDIIARSVQKSQCVGKKNS